VGTPFKEVITAEPDLLVAKVSALPFLGLPDLAAWLREQGCDGIAVCGITTTHCCETTAWAGSDTGFDVLFVLDATHAFDSGGLSADELARATAANLHGEFAAVVATADLVGG
jgi:nicotinamidase-related amidase